MILEIRPSVAITNITFHSTLTGKINLFIDSIIMITAMKNKVKPLINAAIICNRWYPYDLCKSDFLAESLCAIQLKTKAKRSVNICPASDSRASECETIPPTISINIVIATMIME